MRRRGERAARDRGEEGQSPGRKMEPGEEPYQCSGDLERDFPALCAQAGISTVPRITPRRPPSFPVDEEPLKATLSQTLCRIERWHSRLQPRIEVQREQEDLQGITAVFLRGWKLEEAMLGVLGQCLPALAGLRALHLWKVGLTEQLFPALVALVARCPRLRTLSLDGNPLSEPAFHTLMMGDSGLTHLSLRNNCLDDAAACLIGQRLGSASCGLVLLILSFNHISDQGAAAIAEGLRLNRSLLSLSLANNNIGDAGANKLAEVLGPFTLTHAEVVQRRRLLLAEAPGWSRMTLKVSNGHSEGPSGHHSSSSAATNKLQPAKLGKVPSKKKEAPRKEEVKQPKKLSEPRAARSRPSGHEKLNPEMGTGVPDTQVPDPVRLQPLLEEAREQQGAVVMPGNRALLNLNLSYNRITERGLGSFLAALEEQQRERRPKVPGQQGLRRLLLENNLVPPTSPTFVRLQELLLPDSGANRCPAAAEQDERRP